MITTGQGCNGIEESVGCTHENHKSMRWPLSTGAATHKNFKKQITEQLRAALCPWCKKLSPVQKNWSLNLI